MAAKPKMLTVKEICERTGWSRSTVYRLVDGRQLSSVLVARTVRVYEDELERFIAANTHAALPRR